MVAMMPLILAIAQVAASAESPAAAVLGTAPDSAVLAVAVPPFAELKTSLAGLAALFGVDVSSAETLLCAQLNALDGGTTPDVDSWCRHAGIDPAQPWGIFVGLDAAAAQTHLVLVLPCLDSSVMTDMLTALIPPPNGDLFPPEGVPCWTLAGRFGLVSNSLAFLTATAERLLDRRPVRYAPAEGPAFNAGELVILTRLDRVAGLVSGLDALVRMLPPQLATLVGNRLQPLMASAGLFSGDDPIVTTLSAGQQGVEIHSRFDQARHPGLAVPADAMTPLWTTNALSEDAIVKGVVRVTPQLRASLLADLEADLGMADSHQAAAGLARAALEGVGDEVAVEVKLMDNLAQVGVVLECGAPRTLLERLYPEASVNGTGEGATFPGHFLQTARVGEGILVLASAAPLCDEIAATLQGQPRGDHVDSASVLASLEVKPETLQTLPLPGDSMLRPLAFVDELTIRKYVENDWQHQIVRVVFKRP